MAGVMTWQRRLRRCISLVLILLAWETTAQLHIFSAFLLPPLSDVLGRLANEFTRSDLPEAIFFTVTRSLAGFGLAVAVGVPLGLLIARVRIIRWFLDPIVSFGLPTPKIAFLPIFILWFGVFDESKVYMAAFNAIFPIIVATWAGSDSVDKYLVWSANSLGARRSQVLWEVVLPAGLPSIMTGLQIALPFALIITIIAEMSTGGEGLGGYMVVAMRMADSPGVFGGLFCTAVVGFILQKLMEILRSRLLVWHEETQA